MIGIGVVWLNQRTGFLGSLLDAGEENHIIVEDQFVTSWDNLVGTVVITEVVSDRAAWIVIHEDQNGKPGDAIGRAKISAGVNSNLSVDLDVQSATSKLYAILHVDEGKPGIFEYPGVDVPLLINGHMIIQAFQQRLEWALRVSPGVVS